MGLDGSLRSYLRFVNLRYTECCKGDDIANDLKTIGEVIESLIKFCNKNGKTTPHVLTDLLDVMMQYTSAQQDLVSSHLATLSSRERIVRIQDFFGRKSRLSEDDQLFDKYLDSVRKIRGPKVNINWTKSFVNEDPALGVEVIQCFKFNDKFTNACDGAVHVVNYKGTGAWKEYSMLQYIWRKEPK